MTSTSSVSHGRYVNIGHLMAMRLLAFDSRNRPQDFDDILSLLDNASAADIDSATESIELITKRGFDRGKKLHQDFERAQQQLLELSQELCL